MPTTRHYFISEQDKKIKHMSEELFNETGETGLEGFVYCGMSQMPVPSAAGFYAKNAPGYTIIDMDPKEEESTEDAV